MTTRHPTAADAIKTAEREVGYMEKKSNRSLYSKTDNAGHANFTKYWNELCPELQGEPWCDGWVSWVALATCGGNAARANRILCGGFHSYYTPTSAEKYKAAGRWHDSPKKGDQIFFENASGTICHTGIVRKVTKSTVYTIEGNTSSVDGVIDNGGEVARKSYALSYGRIAGYGRPMWERVAGYTTKAVRYLYPEPKRLVEKRIVKVPIGSQVSYLHEKHGNWRKVAFEGLEGWICRTRAGIPVMAANWETTE